METVLSPARETLIIKRLRQFRTIDADILVQERLAAGIGLVHEPRITAAAPEEDYMAYLNHVGAPLSEQEQEIVSTMRKYITYADFATMERSGRIRLPYVTPDRMARRLNHLFVDDEKDDARLQDAYVIMANRPSEEDIKLTDTEQVAEKRLASRDLATQKLEELRERRDIISTALTLLAECNREWYLILWHKYVLGESRKEVRHRASRTSTDLTLDEYRLSRKKALQKFEEWAQDLT